MRCGVPGLQRWPAGGSARRAEARRSSCLLCWWADRWLTLAGLTRSDVDISRTTLLWLRTNTCATSDLVASILSECEWPQGHSRPLKAHTLPPAGATTAGGHVPTWCLTRVTGQWHYDSCHTHVPSAHLDLWCIWYQEWWQPPKEGRSWAKQLPRSGIFSTKVGTDPPSTYLLALLALSLKPSVRSIILLRGDISLSGFWSFGKTSTESYGPVT